MSQKKEITVQGARTHNLKNINVALPRERLTVITGLSGSGKSSLAYDTVYAEGQRRYVESLSTYARQFLSVMEKPDVDFISGLSPAISIHQKAARFNPRSTVGTVTEIYDYLRLLYARVGEPRCPTHGEPLSSMSPSDIVDRVMQLPEGTRINILASVVRDRKGEHVQLLEDLRRQGYVRVRVNGRTYELDAPPDMDKYASHSIEVVVDRLVVRPTARARIVGSVETAAHVSNGTLMVCEVGGDGNPSGAETVYSTSYGCPRCDYALEELEPRLFSFNNPKGACQSCKGLGSTSHMDPNKIVLDSALSLAEGAIAGWERSNRYYFSLLTSLAEHYGFDLETPFKSLPERIKDVVLNGSGNETIRFRYFRHTGSSYVRRHRFSGVVPNFERRLKESASDAVKDELSKFLTTTACPACESSRLEIGPRNVFVDDKPIHEITRLNIAQALDLFDGLEFDKQRAAIAGRIIRDVRQRLRFLASVGLTYVSLDRATNTLSGGELQRIRLASQVGSGLVGVTYVLDEPSIGLHDRDNQKLIDTLFNLRDLGNTIIVVEHDDSTIRNADYVVDLGPGAGTLGGGVVFAGTPEEMQRSGDSLTGDYLAGRKRIPVPEERVASDGRRTLGIRGARGNNLKNLSVDFPLGLFICVTGVSGSGKSTLVNGTLYPALAAKLHRAKLSSAEHELMHGLEHVDKVISINQQPIGRTPRSNPATYTGLFDVIRTLFSKTAEARARGYKPGRFSFNVAGGRCEQCKGDGLVRVEMHFLPDMFVHCEACGGSRYNSDTLQIKYRGMSIADVLDLTVQNALPEFAAVPAIHRRLKTLFDVGLGYVKLGQSAVTLSGGEAQRVKLSVELSKRDTGRTLYILDEPTTGLHFEDIAKLLSVICELRDRGNTIVVIEHNMDVIKTADWIIDMGPEGGDDGGQIVVCGTPEQVAADPASYTGQCLAAVLERTKETRFDVLDAALV